MSLRVDYGKIAPDAAKAMYATNRYLDDSSMYQRLRRLIELCVSQINGCSYCIWLHSRQAGELGEPEERIAGVANWRDADCYSDAEQAAFAWTESVTRIADGTPPAEQFAALQGHFDDRQIVDLTATAANMNALNRLGISMRLEPPE